MTGGAAGPAGIPPSLVEEGLRPVWSRVRHHLDKHGAQRRGTIAMPDIDPASELALRSMLGRVNKRLDLDRLEEALIERGVGADLCEALTRLGHGPSPEAAQRRAGRIRSAAARKALRHAVERWSESWAREWADAVIGAGLHGGLDHDEVEKLASDVRRLVDYLGERDSRMAGTGPCPDHEPDPRSGAARVETARPAGSPSASRTEVAAALFGSAHALDPGTKLAAFATRALQLRVGEGLSGRELWESVGVQADRVSAPVLVWAVPAEGCSAVARLLRSATEGGLPLHTSLLALQGHPVSIPAGTQVLVVENPRLVEAAAERDLECCVVATNGNPTTAVTTLVRQLRESGARLWFHGDFDVAGIAICRRMRDLGCRPWMMDAQEYLDAVSRAERDGVRLDPDARGCGPTPWDPRLEAVFGPERLVVHEEFVLDEVLSGFQRMTRRN